MNTQKTELPIHEFLRNETPNSQIRKKRNSWFANPWETKLQIQEFVKNNTSNSRISEKRIRKKRTKFPVHEVTINETPCSEMQIKQNFEFTERCTKLLQETNTRMAFIHVWVTETWTPCGLFSQFTGNKAERKTLRSEPVDSCSGGELLTPTSLNPKLSLRFIPLDLFKVERRRDKLFLKASIFFFPPPFFKKSYNCFN
jgi:hypothetical protein